MAENWVDLETGQVGPVTDEALAANSDRYALPGRTIRVTGGQGAIAGGTKAEDVARLKKRQFRPETKAETEEAAKREVYGNAPLTALATGFTRGATLGLSDKLITALSPDLAPALGELEARNPIASGVGAAAGGVVGATLVPFSPAGIAAKAGTAVSKAVGGGLGGAALGGAVEGGLFGVAPEVSQSALEMRPIDAERLVASMGSNALLGGALGATFHGLSAATGRASQKLEEISTRARQGTPEGVAIREEVAAIRQVIDDNVPGLKQLAEHGIPDEVRAVSAKAGRAIRGALDTPESLAREPWTIVKTLEKQKTALAKYLPEIPRIRSELQAAGREGGTRWKALDAIEDVVKREEQLIPRIFDLKEAGQGAGVASSVAGMAAKRFLPFGLGNVVDYALSGKLKTAAATVGKYSTKLVDMLAKNAVKTSPTVAPLVSMSDISYGPKAEYPINEVKADSSQLKQFRKLRNTLLAQVEPDLATGQLKMSRSARARVSLNLRAVAGISPMLHDNMETLAARRVEYLANKLPRPKDKITVGPDPWRPSFFQLSEWSRRAGAVEDPIGVLARARAGNVTPEESDALWSVYPEMMMEAKSQIMARLDQLQESLRYEQRIAISILTKTPLDPAMEPNVLEVLQSSFDEEQAQVNAQKGQARMGEIKAPAPTSAQVEATGQ